MEQKSIEEEANKRIEELVAKRVEEVSGGGFLMELPILKLDHCIVCQHGLFGAIKQSPRRVFGSWPEVVT